MPAPTDSLFDEALKGTKPAPTVMPNFDALAADALAGGPPQVTTIPGESEPQWNAGWNLLDAATFGYGHQLAGRGPQDLPSGENIKDKGVRLALANYQRRLAEINESREQWQAE